MRKVIVIGCPGSGRSVFARRLRDVTSLPLHYLDMLWHKPDGTSISQAAFDARLEEIVKGDRWIIDGNYQRTLELRLRACDTAILLDYPLETCLAGAKARIGNKREDLPWVETAFDEEFRRWILDFPATQLPGIYALLEKYAAGREIAVLKARAEADAYLQALSGR